MAEIRLTINGRTRNVNVSRLDWTKAQELNALYGSTPTDYDNINGNYDCIMQTTLDSSAIPTGADDTMIIFRTTHSSGALMSDIIPPEQQMGGRVVYLGAAQHTGDQMLDFYDIWSDIGADPAPASTDLDLTDPDQLIYSNASLTGAGVFQQANLWRTGADTSGYRVNYNAQAYIRTVTGGTFGVSCCNGASGGNSIIVWSFGNYTFRDNSGSTGDRGNRWDAGFGWYPAYLGTGILRGTPTNGNEWNAAMNAAYIDGDKLDDSVTAEIVYTEINGKPYLGCAACKWSGGYITELDVALLPAWFWGDYQVPEDPSENPQYHGFDGTPEKTSGSYSYTMTDIDLPTASQPFSAIAADSTGLHVYRISTSSYNGILNTLWGSGSLSKSLWDRFKNYKFNPVAGILSCHILPSDFMPTPDIGFVQPRAAGAPLLSTSDVKYLNSETTVTESARTIDLPRYFSSHLNWDPYTAVQLFLPFCGWLNIPADRVFGGSLSIQYRCDIITGNVVCFVRCFDGDGNNTFSTQVSGNAAVSIPITGNDNGTGSVIGAITAAAGVAVAGATGVGGAAALIGGAAGAGLAVNTARHNIQTATTYSGNVASLGALTPYLFITMPIEHTSEKWRQLHGLPSGLGLTVSDLTGTGYTELAEFHAEIDSITPEEQQEIENLMKEGVIL